MERLDDVLDALKNAGFEVLEVNRDKGWAAIASKYNN